MKLPPLCSEECGCWVHFACACGWVCTCGCGCTGYLRSTLDTQGAHLIHSHVAHIHALSANLNTVALEVLLVEHEHLHSQEGGEGTIVKVVTELVSDRLTEEELSKKASRRVK